MHRSRFVTPDTDVLTLANGDTLVVKRRLNTGELRRRFLAMYDQERTNGDGRPRTDPIKTGICTIVAYLLDWSVTNHGRPVVIRDQSPDAVTAALEQLEYDDYREILTAIEAHERRQDELRAAEKKTQDTGNESPATLPSPFAVVGATNGSPN